MGDYYVPAKYLLSKIVNADILVAPFITAKTIELGSKYSPDFVCTPFKYTLGTMIEALDNGANILIQFGGGCRYGYYSELQEQILKDLNYDIEFINFIENNRVSIKKVYKFAKRLNPKLTRIKFYYHLINAILMIIIMDKLGRYMREYIGFAKNDKEFEQVEKKLFNELKGKISINRLIKIYFKYKNKYKNIEINKPQDCLKVGIVGELYSIMEPYSSCYIEKKLAKKGIQVKRFTTITYLLLQKKYNINKLLKKGKKYLKYHLGADGTESVVLSQELAKKGYDGIIHIKSFGCTPEINAMPIMAKVSEDYHIPIIYFSFDSQDNTVGVDTRLEAFYDMIVARKEK